MVAEMRHTQRFAAENQEKINDWILYNDPDIQAVFSCISQLGQLAGRDFASGQLVRIGGVNVFMLGFECTSIATVFYVSQCRKSLDQPLAYK